MFEQDGFEYMPAKHVEHLLVWTKSSPGLHHPLSLYKTQLLTNVLQNLRSDTDNF